MKQKASEESDTALPTTKACLTLWQQYLKNYAKTEGTCSIVIAVLFCGTIFSNCSVYAAGKSAMVEGPGILNKEASVAYQNLSRPEKEQLRHQVEQVMSEEKRMTKRMLSEEERRFL